MNIKVCFLILFLKVAACKAKCGDVGCDSSMENTTRLLSRSKRFLVFPDGSSLQLVFCVQTAAEIPIGDIFLYGNTAALAWNLPKDPDFLLMFKDYEKKAQRRNDEKNIYFLDESGRVIAKRPFTRPAIVNPVFAKRSVNEESFRERLKVKIDRIKMHKRHSSDFLQHSSQGSTSFHRNSRVELYQKLETLITSLGADGARCVLRKLCESARVDSQGTFLQELLRVVFTFPKDTSSFVEEHKLYDEAHNPSNDCEKMYPGCENIDSTFL
ncbi:unnamed protein product [Leptosia nina]|uniref:Uncharacterized protein n=1 Tax=Leptosia nina TaxID=320188 RepID=A0AAV1IY43_9NEOP